MEQLTTRAAGYLLLALEGCLYKLKSKCSGWVYFDRVTEQVSVQDPPFVSSIPKETSHGFLAKVVPTVHTICVEGQDTCETEIRQELAAQIMRDISCGRLVVANPPLCGDVPVEQSADLDKQVQFNYLNPPLHETLGCPAGVRFLVYTPGMRGPSTRQVPCDQWSLMRRLTMRGSDLGMFAEGDPIEATGYMPIFVPIPGGVANDPCFEMRLSSQKLGNGLPQTAENCDMLEFRDKGLPTEGWKAVPKGITFHPTTRRSLVATGGISGGTITVNLVDYPENVCGPVWLDVEVTLVTTEGPSGAATTLTCRLNGYILAGTGSLNDSHSCQGKAPITSSTVNFFFTKGGSGTCSATIVQLGYHY